MSESIDTVYANEYSFPSCKQLAFKQFAINLSNSNLKAESYRSKLSLKVLMQKEWSGCEHLRPKLRYLEVTKVRSAGQITRVNRVSPVEPLFFFLNTNIY